MGITRVASIAAALGPSYHGLYLHLGIRHRVRIDDQNFAKIFIS